MKSKFARLRLAALVVIACTFSTAFAQDQYRLFTLSWDAPTMNLDGSPLTDLLGYYVYVGETPDTLLPRYFTLSESVLLGYWATQVRYFAVVAVNADGVRSDFTQVIREPMEVPQ